MKKIKIELVIEKSYEGSCSLEDLLDWLDMTEEEWNALAQEEQEEKMLEYYEDEIYDIDRNRYDYMDYHIHIMEQ